MSAVALCLALMAFVVDVACQRPLPAASRQCNYTVIVEVTLFVVALKCILPESVFDFQGWPCVGLRWNAGWPAESAARICWHR